MKDPSEIIKSLKKIPEIETKEWIKSCLSNRQIQSEQIVLKCPLAQGKIKIPGKHPLCSHLTVLDVGTIIEDAVSNQKDFYRQGFRLFKLDSSRQNIKPKKMS